MGYLYLIQAFLYSSAFFIMFKICGRWNADIKVAMTANYATGFLFLVVNFIGTRSGLGNIGPWMIAESFLDIPFIVFAALIGTIFACAFLLQQKSIQTSGVALTTVCAKSSFIIPVFLSWTIIGEHNPNWLMIALVLAAMIMISLPSKAQRSEGKGSESKASVWKIIVPVALFFTYGTVDFLMKYSQLRISGTTDIPELQKTGLAFFSMFIFAVAFLFSLTVSIRSHSFSTDPTRKKDIIAGIVIGIFNSASTFMMLRAMSYMPATTFYPIYNAAIITLCSLVGILFFKERPSLVQISGIVIAVIAIALGVL